MKTITADYGRTMAAYNRWQNKSLMDAADTLDEAARDLDRGAFFGSIRGTFSHVLWGDMMWMSRFDGWRPPSDPPEESAGFGGVWDDIRAMRGRADAGIVAWAERLRMISGDLTWYSGTAGRELSRPLATCIVHFFNHQTHHRGQIHAMLTQAGAVPEDTDLFLMDRVG